MGWRTMARQAVAYGAGLVKEPRVKVVMAVEPFVAAKAGTIGKRPEQLLVAAPAALPPGQLVEGGLEFPARCSTCPSI